MIKQDKNTEKNFRCNLDVTLMILEKNSFLIIKALSRIDSFTLASKLKARLLYIIEKEK